MERRSSTDLSLLVAWLSNASNEIVMCHAVTVHHHTIMRLRRDSISIEFFAPASSAFRKARHNGASAPQLAKHDFVGTASGICDAAHFICF